jgi:hypothetical protein
MSWILRDGIARLDRNGWSVTTDLKSPTPSIAVHRSSAKSSSQEYTVVLSPHEHHLQGSIATLPLGDAYVRQNDIVAMYPEHAPGRFGYQIDLRAIDAGDPSSLVMEIWLSVQTSLLDSHPKLAIGLDGFDFENTPFEILRDHSHQVGIMIHPLDLSDCRIVRPTHGDETYRIDTFGRFMEKGVIRRARLRLVFANARWNDQQWHSAFQEFVDSPLPLTT